MCATPQRLRIPRPRGIALRVAASVIVASSTLVVSAALAQTNCEAIPAGPARTDCYITMSRIGAGNATIAGTKSQLQTDSANLRKATGQRMKQKSPRKKRTPGN